MIVYYQHLLLSRQHTVVMTLMHTCIKWFYDMYMQLIIIVHSTILLYKLHVCHIYMLIGDH